MLSMQRGGDNKKKEENLCIISIKKGTDFFGQFPKVFLFHFTDAAGVAGVAGAWMNIFLFWWFDIKNIKKKYNVNNEGMLTWQGFIKNKIKTTKGQWQKQRGT